MNTTSIRSGMYYVYSRIKALCVLLMQLCGFSTQSSTPLFVYHYNKGWSKAYPLRPVELKNLIISEDVVHTLVDNIYTFLYSKTIHSFIKQFNMPFKRCILIEGVDGSPKIELLHTLATVFNRSLYDFSDIRSYTDLYNAMQSMERGKGFILFHTDVKMNLIEERLQKLLFDIDWKEPMVCIFVNDFNSYKSRILPSSKMDYTLYIPCLDHLQLVQIYRSMLGGNDKEEEELFVEKFLTEHASVHQIRQWLMHVAPQIITKSRRLKDLLQEYSNEN